MSTTCSGCGKQVSGKFCNNCGTPVQSSECRNCGAPGSPTQRFCNQCGAPRGSVRATNAPWVIALSVAAVAIFAVFFGIQSLRGPETQVMPFDPMAATTDIGQLTPEQSAIRLFDRVMAAYENGITSEVEFFGPMAIQAYALVDSLGPDARYHIGLLYSAINEPDPILAQASLLEAEIPSHLFVEMLRGVWARDTGDMESLQSAYRAFLANYDAETAAARPEYQEHQVTVSAFHQEAVARLGSP